MRLVELHLDADRPIDLVLHARLTVIIADDVAGQRIASVLARAYVLAGLEVAGTLDAGGYMTPLDPTAVVALNLDGDGLRTLTSADLAPPDPYRREAARIAAQAERDRLEPLVDDARAELGRARRRHDATVAAVAAGQDELATSIERRDDLDTATAALEQRPPELERELAAAAAAVDAAVARIEELVAVREALVDELGPSGDAAHLRMGDDVSALVDLVERGAAIGGISAETHPEVLGWLVAVQDSSAPVHPDAEGLIRDSADIERAWEVAAAAGVEGDAEVEAASRRRKALSEQRELLDGLARSGMLGDTAKSEIEAAHVAVTKAHGHHSREHDQALAGEDEVLARYGFDSYLDFTIATSTRSVGQKAQAKLRSVTDELASAERDLVRSREDAAARLQALADQREPVRERIAAFLGSWPDGPAEPLLAAIPAVPAAVAAVSGELDASVDAARDEARRYREVIQELDDERGTLEIRGQELTAQRAHIDERITGIERLLSKAEPEVAAAAVRVDDSAAAANGAAAELAAARHASEELDDAAADTYTAEDIPAVIDALMSRLDPWAPEPMPVVLHDTLAPLGADGVTAVLSALLAGASRTQLIYISDDRSLRPWAEGMASSQVACVELHRPRWLQRRLGRRAASRFGA